MFRPMISEKPYVAPIEIAKESKFKDYVMADVLTIATSGLKPGQIEDQDHQQYPRVDYLELQRLLNTDILNYSVYEQTNLGELFRRVETQLRSDLYLTLISLLKQGAYPVVFAMSERAGLPYAGLHRLLPGRKRLVSMFHCWSWRQEWVVKRFKLLAAMDSIIVHCQSMKRLLTQLGAPAERVHVIPYSVDQRFFSPDPKGESRPGLIVSVGEVRSRNYGALNQAVDGLPVDLVVAASGRWDAREKDSRFGQRLAGNVKLTRHLGPHELRKLYARAQFSVVPVYDTVYSAGATTVLESMAMGRAVIAWRSQGLQDYVIDGETGLLVEPDNPGALREAIRYLAAHPAEARRLGENGRQWVEEWLNLDRYVEGLARVLQANLGQE
ncbi:MAG TPA: glycosyltransferase family 4 protein [Anaerolineae bacterium]|nr:glycosyltransferase family 4 protein [Anaerolineae bacterium]